MPDMGGLNLGALAAQFLQGLNLSAGGGLRLWAVRKDALAESLAGVRMIRNGNGQPAAQRGDALSPGSFATRIGSVAIVPVYGPLMARMNYSYWSYEEIVRDLRLASADPSIEAVLLDVDSPGGTVSGIETAAAAIEETRAAKPMAAHVGGMSASAAYWLSASAGKVVASKTSLVGSVGALIRYADLEGILTRMGANIVEVIASQSPNKRLDPNSDAGKAELQAITDQAAEWFLDALQSSRGIDRQTIMDNYGQGLVFTAADALSRGMIDGVASFEETLAELAARPAPSETAAAAAATAEAEKDTAMETAQNAAAAQAEPLTLEALRASNPDLVARIEEGARSSAADAERSRIAGIEANALPGCEALIAAHKADAGMTPAASAQAIIAHMKEKGIDHLKGLAALDNAARGVESSVSQGGESGGEAAASTPDGWKAEWEKSDKLKAEYPTADSYVATKRREARKAT